MKSMTTLGLCLLMLVMTAGAQSTEESFEQFKEYYNLIDQDLLNYVGEKAHISDFVYTKDIATVTFVEGDIYLVRHLDGRPTAAFFEGRGNVTIDIPSHVERACLEWCAGERAVDEDFETVFIRMADDFDLKLREKFQFEEYKLGWKTYNAYKQAQGEYYFRPTIGHEYDNYFQLLRSIYERGEDGYFWMDFNRYVCNYDPNRPEQVILSYEHRGAQLAVPEAVLLQKKELGVYDDNELSYQTYETTILNRDARLEMEGLDGWGLRSAAVDVSLLINRDSLRFVSMFLHYNLAVDSIIYAGQPIGFWRRGDFNFFGLMLPEYVHKNDTINLTVFYQGKDYRSALPYVKNMTPSPHTFEVIFPEGYCYLMPGKEAKSEYNGRRERFLAKPEGEFRNFYFQPFASGFDTISTTSMSGIPVHFLKSEHLRKDRYECFVPDELYQPAVTNAFNFMTGRLGPPPLTDEVFVYPEGDLTMPGLIEAEQVYCTEKGTGDLETNVAGQVARQWFGSAMRPASDREVWYANAMPDYFGLLSIQTNIGAGMFYSHLLYRRNLILREFDRDGDIPLAVGTRCPATLRTLKGSWVLHMLRFLMYDIEKQSDLTFLRFLRDFSTMANTQLFTNKDFVALAEQYYGESLGWFFHHWLYDRNIPKYQVDYSIEGREDGYYITGEIVTEGVPEGFSMPVWMRVEDLNGNSTFHHPRISGYLSQLELGPFEKEPAELFFNEFYGVLCEQDVNKH